MTDEEFEKHCRVEHKDRPNTSDRVKTSMTSLLVMFGKRMVSSIDGPDVERYKVWRRDGDEGIKAVKSITLRHDLDAFSKLLLMKNCEAQIPGTERYIFKKRGVFKSTASRRGAPAGQVIIPDLPPDAVAEIEFRFATLKPYLSA